MNSPEDALGVLIVVVFVCMGMFLLVVGLWPATLVWWACAAIIVWKMMEVHSDLSSRTGSITPQSSSAYWHGQASTPHAKRDSTPDEPEPCHCTNCMNGRTW